MYTQSELSRLVTEIRRPFWRRDQLWDKRRAVRFGRLEPWLPDNLRHFPTEYVRFVDRLPGLVVRRLKQRLGAHTLRIRVVSRLTGAPGERLQGKLEQLEDIYRALHEALDPVGAADGLVREHQAADGLGVFELEFLPPFVPPAAEVDEDEAAYLQRLAAARQDYGLPVRLSAPDPRGIYYARNGDRLEAVVKVMNLPLFQVRDAWLSEGLRLRLDEGGEGRLLKEAVVGGELSPAPTAAEYGRLARVVVVADQSYIYHLVYPRTAPALGGVDESAFGDFPGQYQELLLCGAYPNPLGRPPFYLAGTGRTSDSDPAYQEEPLALEVLEIAPYINQMRTIRYMRALVDALKPVAVTRTLPPGESEAPPTLEGLWRPGFLELGPGDNLREIPSAHIPDFDKLETWLSQYELSFNQSLMAAVQTGALGRNTPAWTTMMFLEEQASLVQDALAQRAAAWQAVLEDAALALRKRYLSDGPVYLPRAKSTGARSKPGALLLEVSLSDLELAHRLEVTIHSLTQSQTVAYTEYARRLYEEGTISQQTYEEMIGIEDRVEEGRRKAQEALWRAVVSPEVFAREVARQRLRPVYGDIVDVLFGPPPGPPPAPPGPVPEADGAQPLPPMAEELPPRMPGLGMPLGFNRPPNIRATPTPGGI